MGQTAAKSVYWTMHTQPGWHAWLNRKWMQMESKDCWQRRCFRIWHKQPFARNSLWNWRLLLDSLCTEGKLHSWDQISGLCPWCGHARETLEHLFWACLALRGFWNHMSIVLGLVFGTCRLRAHMVMLGITKGHTSDFVVIWSSCRALATQELWRMRNSVHFERKKVEVTMGVADAVMLKLALLLRYWKKKKNL